MGKRQEGEKLFMVKDSADTRINAYKLAMDAIRLDMRTFLTMRETRIGNRLPNRSLSVQNLTDSKTESHIGF